MVKKMTTQEGIHKHLKNLLDHLRPKYSEKGDLISWMKYDGEEWGTFDRVLEILELINQRLKEMESLEKKLMERHE